MTLKEQRRQALIDGLVPPPEVPALTLREFLEESWPILEPAKPFVHGWHHDAIAEHLTAISNGQLKKLIVAVPPGSSKSRLVCVAWFCWEWTFRPATRWLFTSHSQAFA